MPAISSTHPSNGEAPAFFPNTSWSLIRQSQEGGDPAALAALDRLARAYWRPLYACVRAMGHDHHQAEDEVQRLFEHLLSRDSLRTVVPGETRFRSFMLSCLRRSMVSGYRRGTAQKRGNGIMMEPLDTVEANMPAVMVPEGTLDREWAKEVFERAFTLLGEDAVRRGRERQFSILKPVLRSEPVNGGYAALALQLEATEATVRKMVFDLRSRLGALIRQEVMATVVSPAEVEEELKYLMTLL